jgi:hypothetical protein
MGLTATATTDLLNSIDRDDITFCEDCAAPYPLRRRALGYTTCLSCGEDRAQALARRNNVAGASSQPRFRQPATAPLANTCDSAHTVNEYRVKHTDLYGFMRTGNTPRTI